MPTTATQWFFAEGATGVFSLFYLLQNPDMVQPVDVTVRYLRAFGPPIERTYTMAPHSRLTLFVNEVPGLEATEVAADITASRPIVAERAMWWAPSPGGWYEGHVVLGTTTTGTRWALADGMIGGQWQESFYALIANQSVSDGQARVTLVFDDGSQASRVLALAPTSRTTVQIATEFPEAAGRHFSVVVESIGASPVPLVVEGARYSSTQSQFWSAGGAMLGTKLQ